MPRLPLIPLLCATLTVAAVSAGCSSSDKPANDQHTPTSELPPLPAEPLQPGAAKVSPGGVTTAVDVPSDATESQFGQACHAAKVWFDEQGGDPKARVEDYLKKLQEPGFNDPGNFNTTWAELTPAQQSGVIMSANMAADGQCE